MLNPKAYTQAVSRAYLKLARILKAEGDADGERLKPEYIDKLITEEVMSISFSNATFAAAERKTARG